MSDPFELLRSELVQAAGRLEPASPNRPWQWRWTRRHPRPLAVVLAALVICGSATAAVLSLTGSASQPLSGRVPGTVGIRHPGGRLSAAGYRYRIVITPSLAAGQPGWTTGIDYAGAGFGPGAQSAGGPYPTASNPVFGAAGDRLVWLSGEPGTTVDIVLVGPQVAAIRFGGRTIRTLTSPRLPTGDRAAVFFVPPGSPVPTLGWRPGDPIRSQIPPGSSRGNLWKAIPTAALIPVDRAGRVLSAAFAFPQTPVGSFWQAPAAVTPNTEEPPYHGPTRPNPNGICQLESGGLPGLKPVWGHTITHLGRFADSLGELFISCVDTEYYLHGWPLAVGVLVDARRPGQALGPLPGGAPVPGHPQEVDLAAASLSARRVGHAWLVVRGGSGSAQRLRVLAALRISKLDVRR